MIYTLPNQSVYYTRTYMSYYGQNKQTPNLVYYSMLGKYIRVNNIVYIAKAPL